MNDTITTTDVKVNTETGTEPKVFTSDVVNCEDVSKGFTTNDVNNQGTTNDGQDIFTSNTVKNAKSDSKKYNGTANLKPVRSKEEAKERGRKGGLKSGEVRRQKKTMRETLENALKLELSQAKLEELGADIALMNGEKSVLAAIIASTVREAISGDTKAIQFVRDSIGEMPVNKTENVTEVITKDDADMIDNLRSALIS